MDKKIIVGASGASGFPLLIKCLELIREAQGYSSELILSDAAELTAGYEMDNGWNIDKVKALAGKTYDIDDTGAAPASGSYKNAGMLVVPCSMKTLAGIHSGYAENLLLRAADVTIKEQREIVLAVRESPLSPIHLRNMYELSMIRGVHIIPPMMTFYNRPESIEEMTYHIAAKLVEPFGIEAPLYKRWKTEDWHDNKTLEH